MHSADPHSTSIYSANSMGLRSVLDACLPTHRVGSVAYTDATHPSAHGVCLVAHLRERLLMRVPPISAIDPTIRALRATLRVLTGEEAHSAARPRSGMC